jgi:transcription elongation GreA/GreB family factor
MPPSALSDQSVVTPVSHAALDKAPDTGMGRFFSPTTLNLIRKLASDEMATNERNHVLEVLAEEWRAFMRECRRQATTFFTSRLMMALAAEKIFDDTEHNRVAERPPIVLTASDRDKLVALLRTASTTIDPEVALFLREELDRADIFVGEVSPTAVVSIGSTVKFIDQAVTSIRRVKLVHPNEADGVDRISITGALGSALIGLGPGQTISWGENQAHQRVTVLETN